MAIAITGGTGMIGSHLDRRLRDREDRVYIVSRTPGDDRTIMWEPKRPGSLTLPEDVEAVVHLAAAPLIGKRWTGSFKQELLESRTLGTRTVVQAIEDHGSVEHVVSASAVGYYGDRGDERLTEDASPGGDFLATVVQAWEAEAQTVRKASPGTTLSLARSGVVLDDQNGALAEMLNPFAFVRPFHWGLAGPLGNGRQWFPWVHIEDEVRALAFMVDRRLEGPFNVVSPGVVRNRVYTEALGEVLDRPTAVPIPQAALWLLYGEAAGLLYDSQRVAPERLREAGFSFEHPNVREALGDLLT